MHRRAAVLGLLALACLPVTADEGAELDSLDRAALYWQQGYLYQLAGRFHQAERMFRRSVEAHPTAEGHTFLGWSLSHLGRTEEAIDECMLAIEIDPDFGNPYNDIGVYLMDLGRHEEAGSWFLQAMEAPRYCCYQFPHFNYGRLLLKDGDIVGARRHFRRALEYDPNYTPARDALELLAEAGEAV